VDHTGDRVRRLDDGTIEFLGRTDDQVKLRGHRVELGEIEQALRSHPSIVEAVVLLCGEGDEDASLVAYAVPKRVTYAVDYEDPQAMEKLTQWLAGQLPSHMLPGSVVLVDALPLTPGGKVDRAALVAGLARTRF
jgi:acyl-coenzyme A synthetase/AMP-(fatty) acid ligase